jgi:hypothetical protein
MHFGCGEDAGAPLCGELGSREPLHIIYLLPSESHPCEGSLKCSLLIAGIACEAPPLSGEKLIGGNS